MSITRYDLCYGDYVYYNGIITKVIGVMVDGYEYMVADIDGKQYGILQADDIKPIPITMEILEKNGITDGVSLIDSSEIWISKVLGVIEIGVYIEPDYCIDIPLNYVHELQHILRFCNIKKEIQL